MKKILSVYLWPAIFSALIAALFSSHTAADIVNMSPQP